MEKTRIDYKPFYTWVRMYIAEKISRERFEFDWAREQKAQGIRAARLRRIIKCVSR
jgi:hypothetical protein